MNNIFEIAKKRIVERPESESKEFALSVCFEDISSFINHYTGEAKESKVNLGGATDLYLNKIKNRLFDSVSTSELNELFLDCTKAKREFFNVISNFYENQYKIEFNFFSFKEQTNFNWACKSETVTNIKYYLAYKEICEQINGKLNPKHPEDNKTDKIKSLHPNHDPNLWNVECYGLFKYLFDHYYKGSKRQLTNIWFYLKEDDRNSKYIFSATKDLYKEFIFQNYHSINITNFDKAIQKWEDTEYNKINEHRQNYEDSLK